MAVSRRHLSRWRPRPVANQPLVTKRHILLRTVNGLAASLDRPSTFCIAEATSISLRVLAIELAGHDHLGVAWPVPEDPFGGTIREQRAYLTGEFVKTVAK